MDNIKNYINRILQARNTLEKLTINGVENAKIVSAIYDHMTETAQMLQNEAAKEDKKDENAST